MAMTLRAVLALLFLSAISARLLAQIEVLESPVKYYRASTAKVHAAAGGVIIEAGGLEPTALAAQRFKVDIGESKYLLLVFRISPSFADADYLHLDTPDSPDDDHLYLLIGEPGSRYVVVVFNLDTGRREASKEIILPGQEPRPPPTDPPTDPPPTQPDRKWIDLSRDAAKQVNDPATAKKLGEAYISASKAIKGQTNLTLAVNTVRKYRGDVLEQPRDFSKPWDQYFAAMDRVIVDSRIQDVATYAAAIEAIGKGLVEAGT